MSSQYQVLARKYRPNNFHELIGQTHVSKALINAIDNNRLHHAYLFTGTRGVGKTTIARILAKCLNCDTGITSTPCGTCDSCLAIEQGRFIDLIEIDAASRTKVEDTRELLDNVPYAPTQGRYKVYLIDEVHMLSTHSFNALLKTLEEPPEHVKFLLATTDPQKLPITIISRCLQFVLRPLPQQLLTEHLSKLLTKEGISYDDAALWQLAHAAKGSVRDSLSLTDQAIAFGQGKLTDNMVNEMLGLLDGVELTQLIADIFEGNKQAVADHIEQMRQQLVDAGSVFDELADVIHKTAMIQAMPSLSLDVSESQADGIYKLTAIPADVLQLYYDIVIKSRENMALANTPMQALEMCLLRLLAFRPLSANEVPVNQTALTSTNTNADSTAQSVDDTQTPDSSPSVINDTNIEQEQEVRPLVVTEPVKAQSEPVNEFVPETSIPNEREPQDVISQEIVPKDAIPQEIIPDETVPEETVPEEIIDKISTSEKNIPEPLVEITALEPVSVSKEHVVSTEDVNAALAITDEYIASTVLMTDDLDAVDEVDVDDEEESDVFLAILDEDTSDKKSVETVTSQSSDIKEQTQSPMIEEPEKERVEVQSDFNVEANFNVKAEPKLELSHQIENSVAQSQNTTGLIETVETDLDISAIDDPRDLLKCEKQDLTGEWTAQKWDYWLQTARDAMLLDEDELALARQGVMTGVCDGASVFKSNMQDSNFDVVFTGLTSKLKQQFTNASYELIAMDTTDADLKQAVPVVRQHARQALAENVAMEKLSSSNALQALTDDTKPTIKSIKLM